MYSTVWGWFGTDMVWLGLFLQVWLVGSVGFILAKWLCSRLIAFVLFGSPSKQCCFLDKYKQDFFYLVGLFVRVGFRFDFVWHD